jgi:ABC-type transport system involved in multi-copper enzyme maturation permease subunit
MRAMAFLTRSIRQDSRLLTHHLMRGAMAALILYLFSMEFLVYASKSAVGGTFAATVMICCYWFMTLIGGIHFSTAIVEEKEEQTLALLRMTGASSFSILAGKSLPRLAITILLLCVIAPFLILALMLGGVLPLGLLSAILGICCYAVMLSQMGLLASVVCASASRAFLLTSVLWVAFELCHWWYAMIVPVAMIASETGDNWLIDLLQTWFDWVPETSLIANLTNDLLTFSTSDALNSDNWLPVRLWNLLCEVWHLHMGFHLLAAAGFFVTSWLLFESCTSKAVGEGVQRTPQKTAIAVLRPRPWTDAIAWKSWQYTSGGVVWLLMRAAAPVVIVGVLLILSNFVFGQRIDFADLAGWLLVFGTGFFLINMTRLFGRILNVEIYDKTLASLVMLPRKTSHTLWAMMIGLVPAVAAGFVATVIGICAIVLDSSDPQRSVEQMIGVLAEPWFWDLIGWNVLSLHLGLLLTTYVRYGGMIIGYMLLWLLAPMCCMSLLAVLGVAGGGGADISRFIEFAFPIALIGIELVACIGMQKAILRRVEDLAAR